MRLGLGMSRPHEPAEYIHEAPLDNSSLSQEIDWTDEGILSSYYPLKRIITTKNILLYLCFDLQTY